jgi:hypothetical protein
MTSNALIQIALTDRGGGAGRRDVAGRINRT